MIRIYGEFNGDASLARVSKGFASVFKDAAMFNLTDWGNGLDDTAEAPEGATADIGIFVGNLGFLNEGFRSKHKKLYVMVAPNSNTVGPMLQSQLKSVKHLLAPSQWARGVLRALFPDKEVLCVPHGLDPGFRRSYHTSKTDAPLKVLHLSSSMLERKGTDKLLEGWKLANLENSELYLSVPKGRQFFFQEEVERLGIQKSVKITDRLDFNVERMASLYSSMDFVCQPSRGEGFGFVPLEARACGTPVIATDCTGHSEHVRGPGTVIVKTGDLAPIDDFPGAFGPSLSAEDVADALRRAYSKRTLFSADATRVSEDLKKQWSWENQLKEFKNDVS